mgnify:CR=1 FL=1
MPIVVTPAGDQTKDTEVSDSTYRGLVSQVESGQATSVTPREPDADDKMSLWDVVDGTQMRPIPMSTAMVMLRALVSKCSACTWTTAYHGQVAQHVVQVREFADKHKRARLKPVMQGRDAYMQCTGCGELFNVRKGIPDKHLRRMKAEGETHTFAIQEVVMRRYSQIQGQIIELGRMDAAPALKRSVAGANR